MSVAKGSINFDNLVQTGQWGFTDSYSLEEVYQAFKERLVTELCIEGTKYVDTGYGIYTLAVEKYKLKEDFDDRN